ncbi:hypothetical protein PG630_07375 [Riemerella anatipestifer]|nr:hypothetical protein [Riemerella anatipestifer]
MKKTLLCAVFLPLVLNAQYEGRVGVNTQEPKATLEVAPNESLPKERAKGLLIPRLTLEAVSHMTLTPDQHSMLVFVKDVNPTGGMGGGKITGITDVGYYYYSQETPSSPGTWVKLNVGVPFSLPTGTADGQILTWDAATNQYVWRTKTTLYEADGTLATDRTVSNLDRKLTITGDAQVLITGGNRLGLRVSDVHPSAVAQLGKDSGETGGVLFPTLAEAEKTNITSPKEGLMIYNKDKHCLEIYTLGVGSVPEWRCVSNAAVNVSVSFDAFEGSYVTTQAFNAANVVKFSVTNNSFNSVGPLDFSAAVSLNGTPAEVANGLTVVGDSNTTNVTITPGQSRVLTYKLSGTPTTAGTLTANFSRLGLSGSGSTQVVTAAAPTLKTMTFNASGSWIRGKAMDTDNYITVEIENTGGATASGLNLSSAISLSQLSGISVVPNQHSSVSIAGNTTQTLQYKLAGTSPWIGTLKASFTASPVSGTQTANQVFEQFANATSSNLTVNGTYVVGVGSNSSRTVKVTLQNNNNYALNNLDLSNALSISNGLGINGSSNSSVTLPANQSLTLTYPVTGTPTAPGTATATFSSAPFATLTTNFNISAATATLGPVKDQLIVALNYNGQKYHSPATGIPDGYEFEVKIPYTNANPTNGSYLAYEQILPLQNDMGGTQNFKLYYPAGTLAGASGTITAKLRNVSGSPFKAKTYGPDGQQYNLISGASAYTITFNGNISSTPFGVKAIGGVPDKKFGVQTNGRLEHQFVYIPIMGSDGRTWLNNNLGADYANLNSPAFNPVKQATSLTDKNAYGSHFQWGRDADGHELVTYPTATTGNRVNPSIPLYGNAQLHTFTNPCPDGYHVPTKAEWEAYNNLLASKNAVGWLADPLKLTYAGVMSDNSSWGTYPGSDSVWYWSASPSLIDHAWNMYFNGRLSWTYIDQYRSWGSPLRCLQD